MDGGSGVTGKACYIPYVLMDRCRREHVREVHFMWILKFENL